MTARANRRDFIKSISLLPLGMAAGMQFSPPQTSARPPIGRAGGSKIKLSLNAYSFNSQLRNGLAGTKPGLGLLELLEFCAEQNFDAIDPTGYYFPGYPEVPDTDFLYTFKRRAFQLGLDISGAGVRNDFTTPDKEHRQADIRMVKAWIEVAARLGAPVLRVFAGQEIEDHPRAEVVDWLVEALSECVEYGRRHGVLIGIQNHGGFLKTDKQTLEIVHRVDSDWFGVVVDTGNFQQSDPYMEIANVAPYAVNWQIKESPFGKTSPIKIDLKRLMQIVRDSGYRGYMPIETLEISGQSYDPRTEVPRFLTDVRRALAQTA